MNKIWHTVARQMERKWEFRWTLDKFIEPVKDQVVCQQNTIQNKTSQCLTLVNTSETLLSQSRSSQNSFLAFWFHVSFSQHSARYALFLFGSSSLRVPLFPGKGVRTQKGRASVSHVLEVSCFSPRWLPWNTLQLTEENKDHYLDDCSLTGHSR